MLSIMEKPDNHDETRSDRLRPAEASRISGVTPDGLAKMADAGKLTVSKPGGTHRRYLRSEIEALAAPVRQGAAR